MTVPLMISPTGYVSMSALGITGSFFAYGDSIGTDGLPGGGNCQTNGGFSDAQCSSLTFPPLGATGDAAAPDGAAVPLGFPPGGPSGTDGMTAMCLSGTLAKIIDKAGATGPDYSDIWGLGVGLDFNNPNGTAGPWSATANQVVGFSFTVSGFPAGGKALSVEFPTAATVAAGNDSYSIQITKDGNYTAMLTKAATPAYGGTGPNVTLAFNPMGFTAAPWDPTMITAIQFHLLPETSGTTTVTDFCISNLSAIVSQ
jgi:hypothetical protein